MLKVVFLGTPDIAVGVLEALVAHHQVLAVVTMPDKPRERGGKLSVTPVKKRALELGLPVFDPASPKEEAFVDAMRTLEPDVFVVFAYGHILRKNLLEIPRLGPINVHTSLLPKYRGAAPIERAILGGEIETGISIMRMDEGMDTGPVSAMHKVAITPAMDAVTLRGLLGKESIDVLLKSLKALEEGKATFIEQDGTLATFAPKIQKEELTLSIETKRSMGLKVRGLTTYGGVRLQTASIGLVKILEAVESDFQPKNDWEVVGSKLFLKALDGSLEILVLQPEGKGRMETREFLNGYRNKISSL